MTEQRIALDSLRFASNRNYGGEGEIKILAEDIKRNDLINPITVKPILKGSPPPMVEGFEVVAGRRRVLAVTKLGWKDIPCRILEGDEIERADEIAGSENINRLSMHPLDEAKVFKQLLESGRTLEELAKQYDRTVSVIWQRVQLLDLNEDIKVMFKQGSIDLLSAVMLKSLDESQQAAFVTKFQENDDISIWDVKGFISKLRHDKLYTCIADKECAKCTKRTFYSNKALFPELKDEDDLCFDHECYMVKWQKLLSGHIKKIKAENQSFAETNILVCKNDNLAKILGKSITIDGNEYSVVKLAWDNQPVDKPTKTSKPCFQIDLDEDYFDENKGEYTGLAKFNCTPLNLKEIDKKKTHNNFQQRQNPFIPIVNFLDKPEEEAKQIMTSLVGTGKLEKDYWKLNNKANDIESKVKHKVLDRIIDAYIKNPDAKDSVELFLNCFLGRGSDKSIIKKFVGSEKISEIKNLPLSKMCAALYASQLNAYRLPDFDKITAGMKNEIAEWAGISAKQLKEMYLEELAPLMPKPKPISTENTKKSGAKKPVKEKKKKCSTGNSSVKIF